MELSDEVAAGLRRDAHLQFTPLYRQALLTGVDDAIDQRETFCVTLEYERDSLKRSRDALSAVLDELDGTRVSPGVGADFTDALDDIARHRQESFAGRTVSPRTDGHDLCGYLYADCDWTYPVLTAVTRLRGTVNGAVTWRRTGSRLAVRLHYRGSLSVRSFVGPPGTRFVHRSVRIGPTVAALLEDLAEYNHLLHIYLSSI